MVHFDASKPLYDLGQLYLLVMVVRALMSWFPYSPDSPLNPVRRVTFALTEPLLAPLRRIIPPLGMFDMSYLVALIAVEVLVQVVLIRIP